MSQQLLQILGMGLAVLLLIGGIALNQARRSNSKSEARQAMASRNGWSHAADVEGQQWRITGTFGDTAFVAEAQRPRHDSPLGEILANRTRLVAQLAGPGIRIAPAGLPTVPGAGDLLSLVAGDAAKRLGSAPVVAAVGRFGERYEVRTEDVEAARRLLDERLQAALLSVGERWPGSPPIVTWLDGVLTISVGQDLDHAADVEAFLKVARTVVESARAAR